MCTIEAIPSGSSPAARMVLRSRMAGKTLAPTGGGVGEASRTEAGPGRRSTAVHLAVNVETSFFGGLSHHSEGRPEPAGPGRP